MKAQAKSCPHLASSVPGGSALLLWKPVLLSGHHTACFHYVCVCAELLQSCLTLSDPRDCSLLGSSVHGLLQARILGWVAISSSRGSSQTRDRTHVSCIFYTGRWILYCWATREALLHYNTCVYCSSLTSPVPHITYRVNHTMDVVFLKGRECQRRN